MGTSKLLAWIATPFLVFVAIPIVAIAGWFEFGWPLAIFSVVSISSLLIWRQATYRLSPSFRSLGSADASTRELIGKKVANVFTYSTIVSIVVEGILVGSLFLPAKPYAFLLLIVAFYAWWSVIKHGVCNLICNHYVLKTVNDAKSNGSG